MSVFVEERSAVRVEYDEVKAYKKEWVELGVEKLAKSARAKLTWS